MLRHPPGTHNTCSNLISCLTVCDNRLETSARPSILSRALGDVGSLPPPFRQLPWPVGVSVAWQTWSRRNVRSSPPSSSHIWSARGCSSWPNWLLEYCGKTPSARFLTLLDTYVSTCLGTHGTWQKHRQRFVSFMGTVCTVRSVEVAVCTIRILFGCVPTYQKAEKLTPQQQYLIY